MKNYIKNIFIILLIFSFFTPFKVFANFKILSNIENNFRTKNYILSEKLLSSSNIIGDNNFEVGQKITRAEFVGQLCNLMSWELKDTSLNSFTDVKKTDWYYIYIETAVANGAVYKDAATFRPAEFITREEMAIMITRTLGLENIANQFSNYKTLFTDVDKNNGYVKIVQELDIMPGVGNNLFNPNGFVTREQSTLMSAKMNEIINTKIESKNAFYAIRSFNQVDYINYFNSISFGWARLELENNSVNLNFTNKNNNEYNIPEGFEIPFNLAENKKRMLMIAVDDNIAKIIIENQIYAENTVNKIATVIRDGILINDNLLFFDGVVIDFESLKGEESKQNFNIFLTKLRSLLMDKTIFVAVHPRRSLEQPYFDGYDYKKIGELADKVILMAHDFNPKILTEEEMQQKIIMTPLVPIKDFYTALKEITDKTTGILDKNKIMVQFSFDSVQWKLKDNVILNNKPLNPDYEKIKNVIATGITTNYDYKLESPYITFHDLGDGTDNIVWYEDVRSINAKLKLIKLFGIKDISIWRMGIIPNFDYSFYLNVLDKIIEG